MDNCTENREKIDKINGQKKVQNVFNKTETFSLVQAKMDKRWKKR